MSEDAFLVRRDYGPRKFDVWVLAGILDHMPVA